MNENFLIFNLNLNFQFSGAVILNKTRYNLKLLYEFTDHILFYKIS